MNLEQAKSVYRRAIDSTASDLQGDAWWMAVADEVRAVMAAPDLRAAAAVIAWWHHDWSAIGDTPVQAARRLRMAWRYLQKVLPNEQRS